MIVQIFAVRDSKAEIFGRPYFSVAVGAGVRAFADAVNDKTSEYSRHPDDYTLFLIGEFNDHSGELMPKKVQVNLGLASTFVVVSPQLELRS